MRIRSLILFPVLVLLMSGGTWAGSTETADLLLINGKIITVDAAFSIRSGLAVKGDRILELFQSADRLVEILKSFGGNKIEGCSGHADNLGIITHITKLSGIICRVLGSDETTYNNIVSKASFMCQSLFHKPDRILTGLLHGQQSFLYRFY